MRSVDQTTYGDAGDCLAAAVASVFEIPLASVPDLRGGDWWATLVPWLHAYSWAAVYMPDLPYDFTGYCVGLGDGPRGRPHAVVWRGGPDGGIAHDPHPSRGGLIAWPHGYVLFVPLDPARLLA